MDFIFFKSPSNFSRDSGYQFPSPRSLQVGGRALGFEVFPVTAIFFALMGWGYHPAATVQPEAGLAGVKDTHLLSVLNVNPMRKKSREEDRKA